MHSGKLSFYIFEIVLLKYLVLGLIFILVRAVLVLNTDTRSKIYLSKSTAVVTGFGSESPVKLILLRFLNEYTISLYFLVNVNEIVNYNNIAVL